MTEPEPQPNRLLAGRKVKLHNRRVEIARYENGWILRYRKLVDGKIETTRIRLTNEALDATVLCIAEINRQVGPL